MNKKKILSDFNILLIPLIAFSITLIGCNNEVEDIFDNSPQERIYQVIEECNKVLLNAPNGWKMNYETGHGDKFLFLMKFNADNTVDMRADFTDQTATSTYNYNRTDGPVLTFDTYGLLHLLADPIITPTNNDKKGTGYAGDFEFIIQKVTTDSIVLLGRKTYKRVQLVPAQPEDEKLLIEPEVFLHFKDLINDEKFFKVLKNNEHLIADVELSSIAPQSHFVSAYNNPPSGKLTLRIKNDNNEIESKSSELIFNDNGFTLKTPIAINNKKIADFVWDEQKGLFTLKEDKNIIITGSDIPSAIQENAFDIFMGIDETITSVDASNTIEKLYLEPLRKKYNDPGIRFQIYYGRYSSKLNFVLYTPANPMGDGKWAYLNTLPEVVDPIRPDVIYFKVNQKRPYYRTFWPEILENTEEGKALYSFLSNPKGLLIYINSDRIYLIDSTDSRLWISVEIPK